MEDGAKEAFGKEEEMAASLRSQGGLRHGGRCQGGLRQGRIMAASLRFAGRTSSWRALPGRPSAG